jgi:pyruvate, water dikinase
MTVTSTHTVDIHWLGEARAKQSDVVGGKVANLSRLIDEFPVPPGFCLADPSARILGQDAWVESLAAAYATLARRLGHPAPPVAVRSSAVDEDGPTASFAGLNETHLNVRGPEAVAVAVRSCLASFISERARSYRRRHGLAEYPERVAVLVQKLVVADCSGVAFSINPVAGDPDEIIVNASWGLGESVVNGTVTPDTHVLDRTDLRLLRRDVADKHRMTVAVPGGVAEISVPERLRCLPALTDEAAEATARLVVQVEQRMGHPVDVEFAWSDDRLHLLQCRPITTLRTRTEGREQV